MKPVLVPLMFATLSAVGVVPLAVATPMSAIYNVDFSSPIQSFWGPGQSSASFGYDHFVLGDSSFGMRFQTGASTGTVQSSYNGSISVGYDNQVLAGLVDLNLGFLGDSNGAQFNTLLGAFAKVTAYFPVIGAVVVTNPNYSLNTGDVYTPSPPDIATGSDSFTPASTAIGPDIGVGSAQAGIDYDIVQHSTQTIDALNGIVVATHEGDGVARFAPFSLAALDTVPLQLDLPGVWDVQLTSLSLDNRFSTTFSLALVPFVEYSLGVCPFCTGDRLDTTIASFPFYSNQQFALDMSSSNSLASFRIDVIAAPAPAPEPAMRDLMGVGLLAMSVGLIRRKRRTRLGSF